MQTKVMSDCGTSHEQSVCLNGDFKYDSTINLKTYIIKINLMHNHYSVHHIIIIIILKAAYIEF